MGLSATMQAWHPSSDLPGQDESTLAGQAAIRKLACQSGWAAQCSAPVCLLGAVLVLVLLQAQDCPHAVPDAAAGASVQSAA